MSRFTTLLSFPDVNVWLALSLADHLHRQAALYWWETNPFQTIAFTRLTQLGVLRLLTTSAAMNGQPWTMSAAWKVYDRFCEDDRVTLFPEPSGCDREFRRLTSIEAASPKLWADAYLAALAASAAGTVITFDRALASRGVPCVVLP